MSLQDTAPKFSAKLLWQLWPRGGICASQNGLVFTKSGVGLTVKMKNALRPRQTICGQVMQAGSSLRYDDTQIVIMAGTGRQSRQRWDSEGTADDLTQFNWWLLSVYI